MQTRIWQSDRLIYAGFLLLVFWLPMPLGGNRPFTWVAMELLSLVLLTVWLVLFLKGRVELTNAAKNAVAPLVLLLMIVAWVAFQGVSVFKPQMFYDPQNSQYQLVKSISYIAIFWLSLVLLRSQKRVEWLALVIVLGGTLQALIAILFNGKGTFVNRNHFAGYLEMSLAMGIGLMIAHLSRGSASNWREVLRRWIVTFLGPKARVRICLVIMVIGLIVSRSRMGNTAFFLSMFIAGVIGLLLFRKSSRSIVVLFVSLVTIDIFLMGAFFGIDKLQERFEETRFVGDQRVIIRDISQPFMADHLVMGTGAGSFYTVFPQMRDERISNKILHAHNDLIQFQTEFGLVGMVPLVLVVLGSLFTAVRVQVKRHAPLMKSMGFSATMGIIAIVIHSTADFNLQISANAGTFMVLLALPYVALTVRAARQQSH